MRIAVPLPFGMRIACPRKTLTDPCAVNGAPSNRYKCFTAGLGEVFVRRCRRLLPPTEGSLWARMRGYLFPSLPMVVL